MPCIIMIRRWPIQYLSKDPPIGLGCAQMRLKSLSENERKKQKMSLLAPMLGIGSKNVRYFSWMYIGYCEKVLSKGVLRKLMKTNGRLS